MTKLLMTRCAAVAIAASAALPATAVLAQDAASLQPTIILPDVSPDASAAEPVEPAANPAPVIVIPETASETTAPSPVVLPDPMPTKSAGVSAISPNAVAPVAPVTPKPAVSTVEKKASSATTQVKQAATSTSPKNSAVTSTENAPPPAQTFVAPVDRPASSPSLQPDGIPDALSQQSESQSAAAPAATADNNAGQANEEAIFGIVGALGLIAVGGLAVSAMRRRRNPPPYVETRTEHVEQPKDAGEAVADEPVATSQGARASTPVATRIAPPIADAGHSRHPLARVESTSGNGDPVVLPPAVPERFDERDALLKRLIAAKPDRANPFRSKRARAHRAKLIIQSLDRRFESRKPRIDLSQYTNRWPALRGWQPATA
ncbi:hypothetical protein GRI58_14715 [Porphyrobacter algicida]|uniref:LPXTG cell wall anchor domain-containing protein n=1 Tax=Qipengyuania algicida TaxID=1836209 RepID=A0A845AKR4_9SPHN|nr:hypothetical protein [Qipengyuania algicida]MXP30059.1 hypothetical protein [Qipengyuania algicida]